MKYSVAGTETLTTWEFAASEGGSTPEFPKRGEARHFNVDAWVTVENRDYRVNGKWFSEFPEPIRKQILRDLKLPVTKALIYYEDKTKGRKAGEEQAVEDFLIDEVWFDWCILKLKLANRDDFVRIHSSYLKELNTGTIESGQEDSDVSSVTPSLFDISPVPAKREFIKAEKIYYGGLKMPPEFIVFDLETTSNKPEEAQICEIAALRVRNGIKIDEFKELVYLDEPIPKDASAKNHITDDMLINADHMKSVLQRFLDFIGDDSYLVGQYIGRYDLPVLSRVADDCGLAFSYKGYIDTLPLAKKAWPGRASYAMDSLREMLDISDVNAHRALKDCEDELTVYVAALKAIAVGPKKATSSKPSKRKNFNPKWHKTSVKAKDLTPANPDLINPAHPLYLKGVVLTGDFARGQREDIWQQICDMGGMPQDGVTRATAYVAVGKDAGKGKIDKAKEQQQKGFDTKIIGEEELYALMDWEAKC